MEWLTAHWMWITLGTTVASAVANATPNETDNKYVKILNNVVNTLAGNINVKGVANK